MNLLSIYIIKSIRKSHFSFEFAVLSGIQKKRGVLIINFMKVNTFSKSVQKDNAKLLASPSGKSDSSKHQDEQTVKYCTPVKKPCRQRMSPIDQDNQETVTFQRILKRSPASKISTPTKQSVNTQQNNPFSASHINPLKLPQSLPLQLKALLDIMTKVDGYLQFLDTHRGKNSDVFRNIRKNLFDNYSLTVDFSKIRNILYLVPHAYVCFQSSGNSIEIRISLPKGKLSIQARKNQLSEAIYKYLDEKHKEFLKKNMFNEEDIPSGQRWMTGFDPNVDVPMFQFEFQKYPEKQQKKRTPVVPTIELDRIQAKVKEKALQLKPFSILQKATLHLFKQQIQQIIKEKQQKLKQQQKAKEQGKDMMHLKPSCFVKLSECLNLLYIQRRVNNMYLATVVEQLLTRVSFTQKQIIYMIDKMSHKCDSYLQVLELSKGRVLQINKMKGGKALEIINSEGFLQ